MAVYEALATTVLTSSASSVEFTSISSDYEHLQVRMIYKSTKGTQGAVQVRIQFNSDTGTNYSYQGLEGYQSNAGIHENTAQDEIHVWGGGTNTMGVGTFGGTVVDILDYRNVNKFTSVRSIGSLVSDYTTSSQDNVVAVTGGLWGSTAAITSIKFLPNQGSWKSGCEFSLYGWRSS